MSDIFGFSNVQHGGTFTSDEAKLSIAGLDSDDALIQQWSVTYSQNIAPVYAIGSNKVYYSRQHGVGQIQIGRIISSSDLISRFGDACKPQTIQISANNGRCSGRVQGKLHLTCTGTILTQVSWSGQVQQAWVSEGVAAFCAGVSK